MKRNIAMNQKKSRFATLQVERLEPRTCMAGNVTASLAGGILTLTGDSLANEIQAYQTAPGSYRIVGNPGTTVNGAAFVNVSGVTGDVNINLGNGDDFVQLMLVAPKNLNIDMGTGNDFVSLGGFFELPPGAQSLPYSVEVKGNLSIKTSPVETAPPKQSFMESMAMAGEPPPQSDTLFILDSLVWGTANLTTGPQDDYVLLFNTQFKNALNIDTGAGNDSLDVIGISVTGKTSVVAGSGDDSVAVLDSAFANDVTLDGGTGNGDFLMNFGNAFTKPATIKGFEVVS